MPTSVDTKNKGVTSAQGGSGGNSGAAFKQSVNPTLRGPRGDVERGSIWDVRVIRAGQSVNGPIYPAETLREAAESGVFEGVDVNVYKWGKADPTAGGIAHLESKVAEADPRGLFGNVVGVLENVHFNEEDQALDGTLTIIDGTTRTKMLEAYDAGKIGEAAQRNIFGFSIDAEGPRGPDGLTVLKIAKAESLDMVTKPAAGGQTLRLVASADSPDPGLAAAAADAPATEEPAPAEEPIQEASIISVGPYVHPENGDGFAVFVAGRPVDWYSQRDQADRAAEIKDRLSEATQEESPVPQLQENASKISAELKGLADKISSAPDEQVGPMLMEASRLIEGYKGELGIAEAAPAAPAAPVVSSAESDEFARMTAGIREAIKLDVVQKDTKLRESLEAVLGEKVQEDAKDKQIRQLNERLTEQAITFAANDLKESVHDLPLILSQINREGVKVDDNFQVTGLKEAIEAYLEEKPFLRVTESVAPPAPAAAPAAAAAPAPASAPATAPAPAPAPESQVPPLGQSIKMRESVEDDGPATSLTAAQAKAKLTRLRKRMLKGDHKAVSKHRNLSNQMRQAGLL